MKLPWKSDKPEGENPATVAESGSESTTDSASSADHTDPTASTKKHGSAFTPKKDRPTPKRNERERERGVRRGPVSAPLTAKEARARRKELKASMSKEELKEHKRQQRAERREARRIADERMAAGDPRYLLPRDQGEERKLVRNWVDSRRFIANIFLPMALVLLFVMLIGTAAPALANAVSMMAMLLILGLIIEGIWIGRKANQLVRERFPESTDTGIRVGFYAYSRASQPRRLRTPRPQVEIGAKV